MAIAFDNVIAPVYQASGTLTNNFAMGSVSNGVLFVFNETGAGPGTDPSSVKYNGTSLTLGVAGVGSDGLSLWYLVNPPSGTHQIEVISSFQIFFSAISYSGVSQSAPIDNHNSSNGNSTSAAVSITPVDGNSWMISYVQDEFTASFTNTGSDVKRGGTGPFGDMQIVDSNATIGSGSHTQTVTVDSSNWFMLGATIAPAGGSASPSLSPSASKSPSVSPSQSPSASVSPSVSPSISPSLSPSPPPTGNTGFFAFMD